MKVGVLALQGAFARHCDVLTALGAVPLEVRTPVDLEAVDAMVIP
ncbi:MAG: pyridoxal 5'-phosphate synthase glutaminase subunit PdxT, partial [Actinobacteria bacterium]|nr:pyridoxal 5'-phosphate synthase glutaminase subunit PdxT [Actinomycetota bacterium]